MPRRPRSILALDPSLAVLAFATWAILSGVSLLWPGEVFRVGTSYQLLLRLPIAEDVWGAAQLADGLILAYCVARAHVTALAIVTTISAGLWAAFGAFVLLGGIEVRLFSVVGCWEIAMALGLTTAGAQAVRYRGAPYAF